MSVVALKAVEQPYSVRLHLDHYSIIYQLVELHLLLCNSIFQSVDGAVALLMWTITRHELSRLKMQFVFGLFKKRSIIQYCIYICNCMK